MSGKPILCLDFDGVCHSYMKPWTGVLSIPDPPTEGLAEWLLEANADFDIVVFSSRSQYVDGIPCMKYWWEKHDLPQVVRFVSTKPAALVSIDDRALTFTGNWKDFTNERLLNFKPWNRATSR